MPGMFLPDTGKSREAKVRDRFTNSHNLENEPSFHLPGEVTFSVRLPELVGHIAQPGCQEERPHLWVECGLVKESDD